MSTKINALLKQIDDAANEIIGSIHSLDSWIVALQEQRQCIGEEPVTRPEFLEYIGQAIDRRTGHMSSCIAQELRKINSSFFALEGGAQKGAPLNIPLLTGRNLPVEITEAACYWYFKPAIMARLGELAESMDFPDADAVVSVEKRRAMIASIDKEICTLRAERDELASQLQAARITG